MTRKQKKQRLQILREVYRGNGEVIKGFTLVLTEVGGAIFQVESNLSINMAEIQARALRQIKELEETV